MTFIGISEPNFAELPLFTKARRRIPNEFGRPPKLPQAMEDAHRSFMSLPFRGRVERRSADSTYNCCGMVFANRRTAIDPADLKVVLDDEYKVIEVNEAKEGDVVVYRDASGDIAHVGMILHKHLIVSGQDDELIVLSQWGSFGEYIHPSRDVPPQFGDLTEVWTERVN